MRCKNHKPLIDSYNLNRINFWCYSCKRGYYREPTDEEKELIREHNKQQEDHITNLHSLWHDFANKFMTGESVHENCRFTLHGYELLEAIDKWRAGHPEVLVAGCDDDMFMNSSIYFIPHQADGELNGYTMVFVPQNTSQLPATMFLYPSHVRSLFKITKTMKMVDETASYYSRKTLEFKYEPEDEGDKPVRRTRRRKVNAEC